MALLALCVGGPGATRAWQASSYRSRWRGGSGAAAAGRRACSSGAAELPGRCREVAGDELEVELTSWESPLVLECYARWCGPCQLMAPAMDAAAAALGDRARVFKLDTDEYPEVDAHLSPHLACCPLLLPCCTLSFTFLKEE